MPARAFLKTRYRAIPGKADEGGHFQGGAPQHRGALCPSCSIPFLLLWDINARDPRFPRRKFGAIERVPLYFCWGCVSDLAYRIIDSSKIVTISAQKHAGPTFQYEPYPSTFPRQPLALTSAVPAEVRRILSRWDKDDSFGEGLSEAATTALASFFGHPAQWQLDLFHHQFGGPPLQRSWCEETFECPNPECRPSLLGRLAGGKRRKMSFLAGVVNDPLHGLPMVEPAAEVTERQWNFYVSVQFHICAACWTILACNRSD